MKNLKLVFLTILTTILVATVIFLASLSVSKQSPKQEISQEEHFKHHNLLLINKELINKPAIDFELPDIKGKTYSLKDFRGKNIILFFNEGAMCYPSCWQQIIALTKDKRFTAENTIAFSIIVDPPEEWQKAIQKMPELN